MGVSLSTIIAVEREGSAERYKLNPFILCILLIDEGVAFTSSTNQGIGRFG
jgi:hypothetical protein